MTTEKRSKGWVITPDGVRTDLPEPAKDNGTFTLQQLQDAVGGYIEVVVPSGPVTPGKVILADEEGLIKQLPINVAGSVICGRPVVGNIVVIDEETME